MNVNTPRLLLIPATAELVSLEITNNEALAKALTADVPVNWPPEQLVDALPWFLKQLKLNSDLLGWLGWYGLCSREIGQRPLLIASGGFFGLPKDGMVEMGYSVLPQFQGQGYATEMVEGLVVWALSQSFVQRVVAEVSSENGASLRVLDKLGFLLVGAGREAGSLCFERKATLSQVGQH